MIIKTKKASSFFLFDAVIAAIIFFMTISIILASLDQDPEIETPKFYAENLMNFFMSTKVQDITNDYVLGLVLAKNITDPSRTLLEQILIFNSEGNSEMAWNFTEAISESKIPQQFSFNISISTADPTDTLIYSKGLENPVSSTLIKIRRIAITKLETGEIYGPFIFNIGIWY